MSGGFAVVQPDSQLSINAVEGFALEDFSAEVGRVTFFSATARGILTHDAPPLGYPQPGC